MPQFVIVIVSIEITFENFKQNNAFLPEPSKQKITLQPTGYFKGTKGSKIQKTKSS